MTRSTRRRSRNWTGLLALLLVLTGARYAASSVSRWPGEKHARDVISEHDGRLVGGVRYVPAMEGQGFLFDGKDGGVTIPDVEPLRLTRSLTIQSWVRVDGYPPEGQDYGFVVFRGDDRPGRDPYFLGTRTEGVLVFGIDGETGNARLQTPIPLGQFIRVTASLDDHTGLMRLLFNDRVVAQTVTPVRPFHDLDPSAHPGIGIGNHASQPASRYNMPFHGVIDELSVSSQTTLAPTALTLKKDGRGEYWGSVTLGTPAPPDGAHVVLGSSDLDVQTPTLVSIPAGATTATFAFSAPDAPRSTTLTATYNGFSRSVRLGDATRE